MGVRALGMLRSLDTLTPPAALDTCLHVMACHPQDGIVQLQACLGLVRIANDDTAAEFALRKELAWNAVNHAMDAHRVKVVVDAVCDLWIALGRNAECRESIIASGGLQRLICLDSDKAQRAIVALTECVLHAPREPP